MSWFCARSAWANDRMVATGTNQSLTDAFRAGAGFSPDAALQIVDRVVAAVERCHADGRVHGGVVPDRIHTEPTVEACPPPQASMLVLESDPDSAAWIPPALRTPRTLEIPVAIEPARHALQAAGVSLDPRQIDLHALGELLCRLLSGESAGAYSRSARIKGRIPAPVWPVLERAVAMNGQPGFADAAEFRQALAVATQAMLAPPSERDAADPESAPARETSERESSAREVSGLQSDTKPSFVSTPDAPADTSIGGAPAAAAAGAEAAIPFDKLGHYEITSRIGHGGMGDVYLGYERALDRKVAIKVLPVGLAAHPEFVRRFRAEATAAARLIHPNIIQIHFIGEDRGHHYFAMQYVEGESLADLLSRCKKLDVVDGLAIVEQALAGLSAAHRQGLVHRDIKPGNILLDRHNQRALLADFGLVKSLGMSETGHTATGVIMGTVDYMSPEQGRGHTVDGRSDLYSIGVLCYRMFSGRLPFDGDNPTSLIFQHAYEQAPSLASIAPSVPAPVRKIVERLMAKAPADRYQSADDVLADLRAFRAGLPLPSQAHESAKPSAPALPGESRPRATTIIPLPPPEDAPPLPDGLLSAALPKWWERTRDRALSLFRRHAPEVLAKLENTQQQVDGAVAEYRRRQQRFQQLASEAEEVLSVFQTELRDHPTPELQRQLNEQEEQLGLIRMKLAQVNAVLHQLAGQRDLLNARLQLARARGGVRPKHLTPKRVAILLAQLAAVVAVCVCVALLLIDERPVIHSPLRTQTSTEESARQAALKQQEDNKPLPLWQFIGHQLPVNCVTFSEKGKFLVSASDDGTARLWNPDNGAVIKVLEPGVDGKRVTQIKSLAVSPDGTRMATSPHLKVWDVDSATLLHDLKDEQASQGLAFSPDGKLLIVPVGSKGIKLIDVEGGTTHSTISTAPLVPQVLAVSSRGDLAFGTSDGKVGLAQLSSNRPLQILDEVDTPISSLAYTRDGALLAFGTTRGTIVVWDTATGKVLDKNQQKDTTIRSLAFLQDGRWLAIATDSQVSLWDRKLRQARVTIDVKGLRHMAISPDERKLVTAGERPFQLIWELNPEPLLKITPHTEIRTGVSEVLNVARKAKRVVASGNNSIGYWDYLKADGFQLVAKDIGIQHCVDISADGRLAVAGGQDGTVRLWDLNKKQELRRINVQANLVHRTRQEDSFNGSNLEIHHVQFDPNAKNVLVVTSRTSFLWDILTGQENHQFAEGISGGSGGALSPTGKMVAITSSSTLRLWNLTTGEFVRSIGHSLAGNRAAFSQDGQQLLSFGTKHAHVWNLETGTKIRHWDIEVPILTQSHSVALSPDGKWVAVGELKAVKVFDVSHGDEVFRLVPGARALGFSHDGRYLAANAPFGGEGMIRLWDLQSIEASDK